jgi:hypothetical protein
MNTIFSAKILKLDKPISGNFDIVEDPNIDQNRTIPVKYTLKKRSEGTLYFFLIIHISNIFLRTYGISSKKTMSRL